VVVEGLSSVQVGLEQPKTESAPQGIWKIDVHVVCQPNTVLVLDQAQHSAFREPDGEHATKDAIDGSPRPKRKTRTIHVVKTAVKDCTYARDAFPLGEGDTCGTDGDAGIDGEEHSYSSTRAGRHTDAVALDVPRPQ